VKYIVLVLTSLIIQGCQINKPLTLTGPSFQNDLCSFPVSNLKVSSPVKGENVFKFEDIISSGVVTSDAVMTVNGFKRADFNYILTEDSSPIIEKSFKNLFPKTGGSSASLAVNFNYYITKTSAMSNDIALVLTAKLESEEQKVINALYTLRSSYSTFPLTYPSSSYLDELFTEGLEKLGEEICRAK
jgi:hypothetical protein